MTFKDLVKQFQEIGAQVKMWHWQTSFYPEHVALGSFYDSWDDLTDKFIETYAGKYQRPESSPLVLIDYKDGAPLNYLKKVASTMASPSVRALANKDTDLLNILDELTSEASRTAYLLTLK